MKAGHVLYRVVWRMKAGHVLYRVVWRMKAGHVLYRVVWRMKAGHVLYRVETWHEVENGGNIWCTFTELYYLMKIINVIVSFGHRIANNIRIMII
jgi:hypothetical protein